jgi:hypothetical protein
LLVVMVVLLQKAKAIKRESGEIPEQYPLL